MLKIHDFFHFACPPIHPSVNTSGAARRGPRRGPISALRALSRASRAFARFARVGALRALRLRFIFWLAKIERGFGTERARLGTLKALAQNVQDYYESIPIAGGQCAFIIFFFLNLAAHAPTSLRLLQPRCACTDLAAPAPTSLRLRRPRCAFDRPRCACSNAAHAPSLAAHAPKPRCACFDTQPRCACSACYYSVHEAEKIDFCQQYVYFQVFINANKIICFFLGGLPWKVHFFTFDFWPWKKNYAREKYE